MTSPRAGISNTIKTASVRQVTTEQSIRCPLSTALKCTLSRFLTRGTLRMEADCSIAASFHREPPSSLQTLQSNSVRLSVCIQIETLKCILFLHEKKSLECVGYIVLWFTTHHESCGQGVKVDLESHPAVLHWPFQMWMGPWLCDLLLREKVPFLGKQSLLKFSQYPVSFPETVKT